jgi:hypothetical protein
MKDLGRSFINKIVIFSAAIRAAAEARQGGLRGISAEPSKAPSLIWSYWKWLRCGWLSGRLSHYRRSVGPETGQRVRYFRSCPQEPDVSFATADSHLPMPAFCKLAMARVALGESE